MNPILLARHVQESLRELVHTTLYSSNRAFDGMVERFLSKPANFMKGPWISVDMPFQQVDGTADDGWVQPFPEIPLHFAPYQHQKEAFVRLGGKMMKSTLVATGTGSGKTECYLWPILDHCRRNKGKPGIKAILIYPMNALANDQARRIASAISGFSSLKGVRAGIYADAQPRNPTHEVTTENIITDRDTMRRNPPDILMTNYKMLDYLLLRGQDKGLWEKNDPETLRFLVVDEMHTFDGAKGTDLALLLRRLKYRLGTPEGRLVCVGSSATLGAGEEAATELREYAEAVFGENFDADAVVRETRKSPIEVFRDPEYVDKPEPDKIHGALRDAEGLDQPLAALRLAECLFADSSDPNLSFLREGYPEDSTWRVALGQRLLEHHLCQRTLKIIAERGGTASLETIASGLCQARVLRDWSLDDCRALAELVVALVSWARSRSADDPRPLFNVRLQLWIREMTRMVASLPNTESGDKRSGINLFHALDLDGEALRRVLPIVNCNRCGATAHLGRLDSRSSSCWAPLDQLYYEYFNEGAGSRIRLLFHESIDPSIRAGRERSKIPRGLLNAETVEFTLSSPEQSAMGPCSPVWMYDPMDSQGRIDRTCPCCGQAHGLFVAGIRAARLTTAITGTLYTSAQNEERPEQKPRFLMFSDSVQDAAHRAAVSEIRNTFSVCQKSLYQALDETETAGMNLREVIDDVPAVLLETLGADDFTALFIAKEQTWRDPYKKLFQDGVRIENPAFLEQMRLRLGWEYFVDLSYRAHFSHTLEANGIAAADVNADLLRESAVRLASGIRNELPDAPDIDVDLLTGFLSGVVQRMRRQGAVAHPYLVRAMATARGEHGLNWRGAAAQLGIRRTKTLPMPDDRIGIVPVPVTLHKPPRGFEQITRRDVSNWYRDWLFRFLGPADLHIETDPDTVYRLVMDRLEADGIIVRLDGPDGQNRHGYLLAPERITVSTAALDLVCGRCGRRETALAENSGISRGSPCTRIGCGGHLDEARPRERRALERSLRSDRNHRVVAREHTGILEAEDRRHVETGFIMGENRWSPNMMSATPTLELGIDIGDLSTLLLGSVPPEEANYVQRMGRSGRRDGNALNLVLANASPHDLQFWEDPAPMLAGRVRPPGVFLAAEEVLLRQVTAFTLDVYVSVSPESGNYGRVRDVLTRRAAGATDGFPVEWLKLVRERGADFVATFLSGLPENVRMRDDLTERVLTFVTGDDSASLGWRVHTAFDAVEAERVRLLEMREEATSELRRLRKRSAEFKPEEFKKREKEISRNRAEINKLIRHGIDDVPVIKFLTDRGVLPNYAFPEEGVKLTSILYSRNNAVRDEDGLLHVEYSRPVSLGLSELAPGQIFYANGRQVEIRRIDIVKEDLTAWTFCPSCTYAVGRIENVEDRACPKCGDEMWCDTESQRDVVRLKSVLSVDGEDEAVIRERDRRVQQKFDRMMMPFHTDEDITVSWLTSDDSESPFGFEFLPRCTFRDFNFGPYSTISGPRIAGECRPSQPFPICRYCGSLQKPARGEDDSGTHPPNCLVVRDPGLERETWETEVFLMREFDTEAIKIVIPVVGEADDDDLKSFEAAINLGMRRHFSGKIDHVRSTVFSARLDGMMTMRSLYLYDLVPGGSGYLRQIAEHPDTMKAVISRALEALRDCPCNQEPDRRGCFRCVKTYRTQFGPGEPDRDRARQLMETILQKWDSLNRTTTGIDKTIRDALVESVLEKRLLQALSENYGDGALKAQVLQRGRRGFVLRAGDADCPRLWTIEPQVQIDARFRGLPRKRVDFLFAPVGRAGALPVVVEMDGLEYHADTVAKDLLDRMEMIRSGMLRVWTLSWKDLNSEGRTELNPFAENALGPEKVRPLDRILDHPTFTHHADAVCQLQNESSFKALKRLLDGEAEQIASTLSLFVRALVANGRELDQLPRATALTEEARIFLLSQELNEHVAAGGLDLYFACEKISPTEWLQSFDDLRLVLRANLPDPGEAPIAKANYTETWRGLWRLVNLLQGIRGFHVELDGLDTLSPPEMSDQTEQANVDKQGWADARALCDESLHPLIDSLVAAQSPPPDRFGEDLLMNGRVTGMMEFGWSEAGVAVAEQKLEGFGWKFIPFAPESDPVRETISAILQALEETGL